MKEVPSGQCENDHRAIQPICETDLASHSKEDIRARTEEVLLMDDTPSESVLEFDRPISQAVGDN
jgi:hypothetical protein